MANDKKDSNRHNANSSYDAQYPYNHVTETWAGHQLQVDNTPGAERIFLRHSKGTFVEIRPDGGMATTVVGDSKDYYKAGHSVTVDENSDQKVTGHLRMNVGGGVHIEVAGDAGIFVGGDLAASVTGAANIRAKSIYMGSDGDMNMNIGGTLNIETKGDMNMKSGGDNNTKASKIRHN